MKNTAVYYKTDSGESWELFIRKCKYAFGKVLDCKSVKFDEWSTVECGETKTWWDKLNETGRLEYTADGIVVDLEFGNHIYVELRECFPGQGEIN